MAVLRNALLSKADKIRRWDGRAGSCATVEI
jgi:hypothetical protein